MFHAVTIALLVTMALALIRAIKGPTVYDRVLAVNMIGTKTVLLLFQFCPILPGKNTSHFLVCLTLKG